MRPINAAEHARKRMDQRAIGELTVSLIQTFGENHYQKGGADLAYIPRKTIAALRKAIDNLEKVQLVLDGSGKVITAQHNYRKVRTTLYVA